MPVPGAGIDTLVAQKHFWCHQSGTLHWPAMLPFLCNINQHHIWGQKKADKILMQWFQRKLCGWKICFWQCSWIVLLGLQFCLSAAGWHRGCNLHLSSYSQPHSRDWTPLSTKRLYFLLQFTAFLLPAPYLSLGPDHPWDEHVWLSVCPCVVWGIKDLFMSLKNSKLSCY